MPEITVWSSVSNSEWTFRTQAMGSSLIAYRLRSLPDFTHQRFSYLSEEVGQRTSAVGKRQLLMLRQIHDLGPAWSCSMRLLKTDHIELFLMFRHSGERPLTDDELGDADARIRNALPQTEYNFQRVDVRECPDAVLSSGWAQQITEIDRREEIYHGAPYP